MGQNKCALRPTVTIDNSINRSVNKMEVSNSVSLDKLTFEFVFYALLRLNTREITLCICFNTYSRWFYSINPPVGH